MSSGCRWGPLAFVFRDRLSSSDFHPEQDWKTHKWEKEERRKKLCQRENAGTCKSEIIGRGVCDGGLKKSEVESRLCNIGIRHADSQPHLFFYKLSTEGYRLGERSRCGLWSSIWVPDHFLFWNALEYILIIALFQSASWSTLFFNPTLPQVPIFPNSTLFSDLPQSNVINKNTFLHSLL